MDKPELFQPPQTPSTVDAVAQPDPVKGPWLQLTVPRGFEWNRYRLPIPNLPSAFDGFRIVQIADLHLRAFWSDVYDHLIARVRQEAPDVIFMTGDLVNNKRDHTKEAPFAHRLVSQLHAPHGIFGVLGNHDQYALPPKMEGSGIRFLHRRHLIQVNGAQLEIIGLPGVVRSDVTRTVLDRFPPKDDRVPRLILSHYPDILRKAEFLRPDVYFAGHTHGGQICLPGGIPIIRHDSLPRRLTSGVHKVKDTWLVVSRGLGFTTLPIRLFCPAEVIEVTLVGE
jgi:predicted MPP superfamily phosphohydrolase